MAIIHIVMFAFKPEATPAEVQDLCDRMLALKTNCVHPETKKTYIKSATGGKENSAEGLQNGITHVFVSEFENEEDVAYYTHKDPAHLAFVKSLGAVVSKVQVVDFAAGVF
ncbi:stress responsive A/B barrel domain protein [Coniochaeta ligniaria NRRL 30616]|uniref:Stress responsive A/B barrel domain protein n=1 Tax=Coniochaeta ligniaria NRRL 30616 TaxID=1408157 RepID=A0A1J7JGW1_9PEZI|nr:stress responsive A/B barrel domain protein [Coniochaeta ligniaria NRRL 30616]